MTNVKTMAVIFDKSGPSPGGRGFRGGGSSCRSTLWGASGGRLLGGRWGRGSGSLTLLLNDDVCVVTNEVCYLRGLQNNTYYSTE